MKHEVLSLSRKTAKFFCLVLVLLQVFYGFVPVVFASTSTWDFSTSSDYTFDNTKIEFSPGQAQLKATTTPAWYNTSWKYRKKITFDNSAQAQNLANFPVLVRLDSSLINYSNTQDSGQDIRFTDSDGTTLLPYEIEKWDETATSSVWVKIPQIDASSATDNIYVYYGNASATDGQSANSVWDSNFTDVQHLEEAPGNTVETLAGGFGSVGEGIATAGNYLYVSNGSDAVISKINLTTFAVESTLNLGTGITETMTTDGTYLYVGRWTSPAKIARIRLSDFTLVDTLTLDTGDDLPAGMHIVGTNLYTGLWVSPGRVSKIDLTTFTKTATLTLASGENHAEEAGDDGTYLYIPCENSRHIVKIRLSDFTEVGSTQLQVDETEPQQVLVNGSYVYVVTRQGSGTGNAGKLIRIPISDFQRSSGSVITTIKEANGIIAVGGFIYIGNFSSSDPAIAKIDPSSFTQTASVIIGGVGLGEGIVDAGGYIYAMSDVSGNSASTVKKINISTSFLGGDIRDSTSNANYAQTAASMDSSDQVNAKIGKGLNFDGTSDYTTTADASSLKFGTGDFTVSLWAKRTVDYTSDADPPELIEKQSGTPLYQMVVSANSNLPAFMIRGTTLRTAVATTPISNSAFTYITAVVNNGTSVKMYINGALEATTNFSGAENTDSTATLLFGKGNSGNFGGILDEIRLSNTARSAAWIAASYKSENNTFNSFGSEETDYTATNPTVQPTSAVTFTSLSGFVETSTLNGGAIKYQISNNGGTTWYWYNSGWTTTVSGYTEASTASQINSNIATFPVGSGQFLWRAYLHSDGTQLVQLDNLALTYINDTTPPVLSSGSPSGTLTYGTTGATLSLTTDENATCKYGTVSGTVYASIANTFTTTGGTSHSASLTGLSNATSYTYYVRCQDGQSNSNSSDYTISFSIAADSTVPTVSITAPANSATVSGSTVAVSADASDNETVAGVKFYYDDTHLIGIEDTSSPYALTWDSTAVSDGSHTLSAVARDNTGNVATSSSVSVTVHNAVEAPVSHGGGGGFSPPSPTTPVGGFTATADITNSQNKTVLHFGFGNDITNIAISDNVNFTPATYINATSSVEWTVTSTKILYVKYCNKYGRCSIPISLQINAHVPIVPNSYKFYRNLSYRMTNSDVKELQKYLNANGFVIAQSGAGSLGKETNYFGLLTYKTLIKFQEAHASDILTPNGLKKGTGYFGPSTRAFINK